MDDMKGMARNMHETSLKTRDGRAAIRDEYRMCLWTWALGMKGVAGKMHDVPEDS